MIPEQVQPRRRVLIMKGMISGMLLILTILYIVSPVDAFPGPIDDIIVLLMSTAVRKRLN